MFPERVCLTCDWNSSEVIGMLPWQGQNIQCCFPYSALGRYLSFLYDLKFHTQIPKTLCFKEKKIWLQWFYITHNRLISYSNLFHSPYCKLSLLALAPDQHPFLQAAQHTHGWALPSKGLSHIPMQVLIRTILEQTQQNWQDMTVIIMEILGWSQLRSDKIVLQKEKDRCWLGISLIYLKLSFQQAILRVEKAKTTKRPMTACEWSTHHFPKRGQRR